jgi:hypothetical protein
MTLLAAEFLRFNFEDRFEELLVGLGLLVAAERGKNHLQGVVNELRGVVILRKPKVDPAALLPRFN